MSQSPARQYRYVLFDLDGTVTDSEEGIIRSIKYCLSRYGINDHDTMVFRKFIGPPLVQSLALYYDFSPEEAVQAVAHYREYFSEKGMYENRLYEGIDNLLRELHENGKKNILATAKPTFYAEKIIRHFNIHTYFNLIVGSNMDGTRMDKGEIIRFIMESLPDLTPEDAIMIGDRKSDMVHARDLGLDTVWVDYGYGDDEEREDSDPLYIARTVEDLYPILMPGTEAPTRARHRS